ncbi:MAG: CoA-binding protein [Balneola sp.]|nr:CoA-binding protein [Balneola sp.]MBO6651204.1 CoA-binding protein [Balneola sp.]MBO6710393.1 CoA-binding protein [Balneola sp.]MBO6799078.1 CoA-binding protein [Balneola sp.]MBO6870918.1 CoA-binding protein [Balneola sp.]
MSLNTPDINEVLNESKTIAIVGCSASEHRTSNYIAKFLKERGYTIIPVNPSENEILGEKCYDALNEIPSETTIDIVDIFRANEHTAGVVEEVLEWNKKTGQSAVVWTQLDVSSDEAEQIAEESQIPYVKNRCIMVELERMQN